MPKNSLVFSAFAALKKPPPRAYTERKRRESERQKQAFTVTVGRRYDIPCTPS